MESKDWMEQNLVAFALGELSTEDDERMLALIADDPQWEGVFGRRHPDEVGHVPVALLARWQEAGHQLSGLERELILQHVESCPTCRQELTLVGADVADWQAKATSGTSAYRESLPFLRNLKHYLGGGVIGAALAATLVLMLMPTASEQPVLHGQSLPTVVPRTLRGGEPDVLNLGPDQRAFIVAMALPTSLPANTKATIFVKNPAGKLVSQTDLGPSPWMPPVAQIVLVVDRNYVSGLYKVELQADGEPKPRSLGLFQVHLDW